MMWKLLKFFDTHLTHSILIPLVSPFAEFGDWILLSSYIGMGTCRIGMLPCSLLFKHSGNWAVLLCFHSCKAFLNVINTNILVLCSFICFFDDVNAPATCSMFMQVACWLPIFFVQEVLNYLCISAFPFTVGSSKSELMIAPPVVNDFYGWVRRKKA